MILPSALSINLISDVTMVRSFGGAPLGNFLRPLLGTGTDFDWQFSRILNFMFFFGCAEQLSLSIVIAKLENLGFKSWL